MWVIYDLEGKNYLAGVFLRFALWGTRKIEEAKKFDTKSNAEKFIAELTGKGFNARKTLIAVYPRT